MATERVFKTYTDLISAYEFWSASLTKLTPAQLINNFAAAYKLTPGEKGEIASYQASKRPAPAKAPPEILPPGPPKPPPPKPLPPKPPPPKPPEKPPEKPPTPEEKPPGPPPLPAEKPPPREPTVKPELIIERTAYPKWWKEEGTAKIGLSGPGSQMVISARSDYSLYIGAIVLTVTDETDIVFTFGQFGPSGAMSFGGSDEPRGLVIAMGNSPAPCGSGSFMVTSDGADASVQGFVSYFLARR